MKAARTATGRQATRETGSARKASKPASTAAKRGAKKTTRKATVFASENSTSEKSNSSSGSTTGSSHGQENECEQLRRQLESVLLDHQRQEEEIVALRAVAKALQSEVAEIQKHRPPPLETRRTKHEFFLLDEHVEKLEAENAHLTAQLAHSKEQHDELQQFVQRELRRFELLAVKARAELASVAGQLEDEQAHADALRGQVAYYKARCCVPVRDLESSDSSQGRIAGTNTPTMSSIRESFLQDCALRRALLSSDDDEKENWSTDAQGDRSIDAMEEHFARVLAQNEERKRPADQKDVVQAPKRSKTSGGASTALSQRAMEELLEQAEQRADLDTIDARALKAMAQTLDKKVRKNALLRSKHADQPDRFMESEVALDEELTRWKAVAATPSLYAQLVELDVLPLLLGLFTHDNMDIRLDVISLLAELTDVADVEASADLDATQRLVQALLMHQLFHVLVPTLFQLDAIAKKRTNDEDEEEEEAAGVYNVLQLIENTVDLVPAAAVAACSVTTPHSIFRFLLDAIAPKRKFTSIKLYASEVLSILLQADPQPRASFLRGNDGDGKKSTDRLDVLLQAIAPYRKRNPASEDEEEFVENVLNAMCSLLLSTTAQDQFRRLEGFELLLRCLKDRGNFIFHGALRVLDHALMNNARNCERVVEIGGLRVLFAVFMGKKKASKASKKLKQQLRQTQAKEEEHTANILVSLCSLLRKDAPYDVFERFHAKFLENDMEKLDRLVDLFVRYESRMQRELAANDDGDADDDEEEEDRYLRKLDAGLFVVQSIAFVIAHLSAFSPKLRAYVFVKCHEQNIEMEQMADTLREQLVMLGGDNTASNDSAEQDSESKASEDTKTQLSESTETRRRQLSRLIEALSDPVTENDNENTEAPETTDEPTAAEDTATAETK
ncbi:TPA: hypothetical protein N0F65_008599 [Lagenidium giganteum]|uniref:Beta-catenin-like protein 1 N-terminal domain-containing protein n=1 Tax=Lagenidium giganteum TaxID=4803 RepID=A0AAV2YZN2_9STRA|nr:TPA: hypothetical protein N0F65_008599 [Lagenidium giganteum]